MATVSGRDRLEPAEQAEVRALAVSAEAAYGAPPLNDQAFSRLSDAEPGLIHLLAEEHGELIGYAQLDHIEVTVVGRPDAIDVLLTAGEAAAHSDQLLLWSHGQRSAVGTVAEARGYEVIRTLWQLRRPLSAVQEVAPPPGVTIRTFVPGQDEAAWLQVNAAAFATHPEQGRWTWRDLAAREAEPWFDPSGFFLAEQDDAVVGFHWTKQHSAGVGEVYVLGVDPAAQGVHLGPALLSVGLEYLAAHGSREVLLYVEEDNQKALALYERFGFARYDRDVQYRRMLTRTDPA